MVSARTSVFTAIVFIFTSTCFAQLTDVISTLKSFTPDSLTGWKKESVFFFNSSQTSLTNWASGGMNSLSLNGLFTTSAFYRGQEINWDNSAEFGYGIMNQGNGKGFIKTDDNIYIATKYGYRIFKEWYYAGLLTLRTQSNKGYNYPNDSIPISEFLSPGHLVGAIGIDHQPNSSLSLFISPLTLKTTLVLDETLSDSGTFGVKPGKHSRSETGGFLRLVFNKGLAENIRFDIRIDLFSNYINKPQNIDINWEMRLTMKAYKLISASLSTYLLYDDDTDIEIDENQDGIIDHKGPRIQFKELFGVGITLRL